jgi:hypothetical protein
LTISLSFQKKIYEPPPEAYTPPRIIGYLKMRFPLGGLFIGKAILFVKPQIEICDSRSSPPIQIGDNRRDPWPMEAAKKAQKRISGSAGK